LTANLLRALLGALAAGVLPGYFWAGFVRRSDGLAERLAYSAAVSMAMVPAIALFLARILGTGVTVLVALAAIGVVAGSGALACKLKGPGVAADPALPPPSGIRDSRVLLLVVFALGAALASQFGVPTPTWLLITILAALAVCGLLAGTGTEPDRDQGPIVGRRLRAPAITAVLLLTAVLAYAGVVRHDWPYLRGEDQFSHAVMTEQMLAHGSYGSYLVYPPGFSTMSAVICRLTDMRPLVLFPVLAPALLLLTTIGAYALATRLWGWRYGLAAAALSGLVLVGPYVSFGGGLYPDLLTAFFLMVMLVAALITLYQSPSVRSGLLVAVVGASVVLYHSVGSLYLVLLLAAVALVCLPYLLLRVGKQGRALTGAITLALAALGALSVAYAWYIYDLGRFFSAGTTARATVVLDVGSQPVLRAGDLFAWVGRPIIWLGVFGFAALAMAIRRLARPAQVLTAVTVLVWCALMYLGSRTVADGFPQRFERDVGAPLSVLAALGLGIIMQSLVRLRAGRRSVAVLAAAAAAAVIALAAEQFANNLVTDAGPSREVLTRPEAAAGRWLQRHNTGGTIISTPDLHRGVTNRAVLAMGGYTGLQSYPLPRIEHPRSLPTAGRAPLLESRDVLLHPATCRAASVIAREDVRFIFLYRLGTEANFTGFRTDPAEYRRVFENSQIVIYAPRHRSAHPTPARCCGACRA
jgi:hypothetical protein